MSKPKYKVSVSNTSVTIDERGYAGTLTFGVGGPIAADYFAKLANEINSLEEQLAQKDEALRLARELSVELARDFGKFSMNTTFGSTPKDEIYCGGWNDACRKIAKALAEVLKATP